MKTLSNKINYFATLLIVVAIVILSSCINNKQRDLVPQSEIDSLRNQIKTLTAGNAMISQNLTAFDTLDYTVFSNQEWTRLHESHSNNIKVNWPDGHFTTGIERHISDLKAMFVYAPNTCIKQHPLRFGSGNMTCVTGVMTGTFSAPMPIGFGKFIQPTGKSFLLPMCTVGIWKEGVMIEEYLFWDNQSYVNQLGLGK
jgi:hypothetical protein